MNEKNVDKIIGKLISILSSNALFKPNILAPVSAGIDKQKEIFAASILLNL